MEDTMFSQKLQTFLRDSSIPLSFADPSRPDCPLIEVNPAFEALTGYARGDVIGKNCRFLQADLENEIARDDIRSAIANGTDVQVILRNRHADGTPFENLLFMYHLKIGGKRSLFMGSQFRLDAKDAAGLIDRAQSRAVLLDEGIGRVFAETARLRAENRRRLAQSVGGVVRAHLNAGA